MRQVARLQKENETLKQQGTRAPEGGRHAKKGQPERVAMTPEATPPATRRPPGGTVAPLEAPPMMRRVPDLPSWGCQGAWGLLMGPPRSLEKEGWDLEVMRN